MNRIATDDLTYGLASPEQMEGRTGLEILHATLAGEIPSPPIARTLDYLLVEIEEGRAVFEGQPTNEHLNPAGVVHGGYLATLLDTCMTCAAQSTAGVGEFFTTVEFKVSFLRPVPGDGSTMRAEGKVIHKTRRAAFAEGRLTDAQGRLVGTASTTCMLIGNSSPPKGEKRSPRTGA